MIVYSDVMRKLMAMVERVARGNAGVLITGETGSGKELIARSLHHKSLRSGKVVLLPEIAPQLLGVRIVGSF